MDIAAISALLKDASGQLKDAGTAIKAAGELFGKDIPAILKQFVSWSEADGKIVKATSSAFGSSEK